MKANQDSQLKTHQLENSRGDKVTLLNFGARVTQLLLLEDDGARNVVLGFENAEDYLDEPNYLGATVGRYANRIAGAKFSLENEEFSLSNNENENTLHGGIDGFHRRYFNIHSYSSRRICYSLISADGDQGFPGELEVFVTYEWTDARELKIFFEASSNKTTPVNLTHHSYFNLDGVDKGSSIEQHEIALASNTMTPVDQHCIPTGEIQNIKDTVLDFSESKTINDTTLDFNYIVDGNKSHSEIATLTSSDKRLRMFVSSTLPAMQVYTGQYLQAPFSSKQGLCVEPQFYPDSPNQSNFPTTLISPKMLYKHLISYRFESI